MTNDPVRDKGHRNLSAITGRAAGRHTKNANLYSHFSRNKFAFFQSEKLICKIMLYSEHEMQEECLEGIRDAIPECKLQILEGDSEAAAGAGMQEQ